MSRFKTSLLGLATTLALFGVAPASAASLQVWDGAAWNWSNNGTSHLTGPILIGPISSLPCNADFTMTIVNGNASITNVVLSGSTICSAVTTSLPWPAVVSAIPYMGANPPFTGAPMLTPLLWSVTFTGVRISVPPPFAVNCPNTTSPAGSIAGVLDVASQSGSPPQWPAPNRFVFKQTLGACVVQTRTNTPPNSLVANPALKVVP